MSIVEEHDSETLTILFISGIILLLVVPFHLLLIVVLVRYRKEEMFLFPFFRMLLSLSINDVITCLLLSFAYLTLCLDTEFVVAYVPRLHYTCLSAVNYGGIGTFFAPVLRI